MQGSTNIPLNHVGRSQAKKLGITLQKFPFDIIYASPLIRALMTARVIHTYHPETHLIQHNSLKERTFGEYEGKSYNEINALSERFKFSECWNYPFHRSPGGESLYEVRKRIQKFFDQLLFSHAGKTIVIVSHGVALRIFLGIALNLPMESLGVPSLDNASITLLEHIPHHAHLHFINYTKHLLNHDDQ